MAQVLSTSTLAFGSRTNSTVTAPSGISNGNLLLCIISVADSGDRVPPTITPPTGWDAASGLPVAFGFLSDSNYGINYGVYTKIASSESGNYTFTHSAASTEAIIYNIGYVDSSTPLSPAPNVSYGGGVANSSGGTIIDNTLGQTTTWTGLTTPNDNSLLIATMHIWDDTTTTGTPSGTTPTFANRYVGSVITSADGVLATAGATGNPSCSNGNNLNNSPWAAIFVSVKSGTSGGPQSGDLLGTLTANGGSQVNPSPINGSVAVSVGDLVYAVWTQQTNLTVGTGPANPQDNLGNTYAWCNAGTDPGTPTARAGWAIVTTAGTLTQITAAATASTNNYANFAAVIKGPFQANANQPDANPANGSDNTSPFACPSTGTLAQADEVVMCFWAGATSATQAASSPNLLAGQEVNGTTNRVVVGYQKVSATTDVAPEFTGTASGNQAITGTTSFKLLINTAPSVARADLVLSTTAPTVSVASSGNDVAPTQGNLALSQTAPLVVRTVHVAAAPAQGNAALSGTAPTVEVGANISRSPARADLALSQSAPQVAVTAHRAITPSQGNIVSSTASPVVVVSDHIAVSPARADVTLSTTAPIVGGSIGIFPSAGNLITSSVAPSLSVGFVFTIAPQLFFLGPPLFLFDYGLFISSSGFAVVVDHLRVPAQGSATLSTSAPTVTTPAHRDIAPGQGSAALSTSAPTVQASANINSPPARGDLALSATAPAVAVSDHVEIIPSRGDTIISTAAPGIVVSDHKVVAPSQGSAVLSTTAPAVSLSAHVVIATAQGGLALSTAASGIEVTEHQVIAPTQGDLEISTTEPQVQAGDSYSIILPTANLAASSQAPTLQVTAHRIIAPAQGSIILSATSLARVVAFLREPAQGAAALSTTTPIRVVDHRCSPAQGDVAISVTAPERVVNVIRAPAQGGVVISTTAPSVLATDNRFITFAQGNLALSLSVPQVQTGNNFSIVSATVDLVVSSQAPVASVSDHRVITPVRGGAALSTTAPLVAETFNHLVILLQGDVAISTTPPLVEAGGHIAVQPAPAELAIATTSPIRVVDVVRMITRGDIVLTSFVPKVHLFRRAGPARRFALGAEDRSFDVAAEDRSFDVGEES